jgi:hypothetical protein
MTDRTTLRRSGIAVVIALAFLAVAAGAFAQQLTGNIIGNVTDEQGGRLPGVTVTLTGMGAPLTQTTDARGEYRFVGLAPGKYTIAYDLQGFGKVTKSDVQVATGQNTVTATTLRLSTVEAAVTVRGEAALLDTRKVQTGAVFSQTELQSIPTARDPWVLLQSTPGIQVDRLNVGGNESGQQSNFVGKGASRDSAVWNVDGVTITDMGAIGASPAYYDFDSFEEMQFSTGGTDLTAATPGVQLNMVTKRGTNDVHGSARVMLADDDWESQNLPDEARDQGRVGGGNSIDEVLDYGVELGGPLWRDRVWLWGSYGRNQIDLRTITNAADRTTLEGINGKLNIQLIDSLALTGFYSKDDKIKLGRNVGATRPAETGWNQDGPTTIYKGEASWASSKFFLTGNYAYVDGGFQLLPATFDADPAAPNIDVYQDEGGVYHNSYYWYQTSRPQHQTGFSGSYFFNIGDIGNELKFGFQYRDTPVNSLSQWSGSANVGYFSVTPNIARLSRTANWGSEQDYTSFWLGDTLTMGNLTINAGLRYDQQEGHPGAATVFPNSIAPDILPGFSVEAGEQAFEWEDISPRIGATYALGDAKRLILKGSYSRFADQMGAALIYQQNAIPGYSWLEFYWDDDGDRVVERDEVDFASGQQGFYNVDPTNPTSSEVFNETDPNFEAGITDEIILGADYELSQDLVVGAAYTYRTYEGVNFAPPTGVSPSDFTLEQTTVTGIFSDFQVPGSPITVPTYRFNGTLPPGTRLQNRVDYEQIYHGFEATLNKRLSNRWMARASFSWNDWTQDLDSLNACGNPNNTLSTPFGAVCPQSGEIVAPRSAGSGAKAGIFINSEWTVNVSGMYQLPLDFNIAANIFGRQGYPYPKWVFINPDSGNAGDANFGNRNIVVGSLDDERHEDIWTVDMRLEKVINLKPLTVALAADVFNLFNADYIIQRNGRLNQSTFNRIDEVIAPRVLRLGARLTF